MKIDISWEIGRLLIYIAELGTAIRLNSPYRGDYESRDPREVGLDVMWLSDSLQCLDRLGLAIQADDPKKIVAECDALLSYYRMFTDGVQGKSLKGDPKATFERYAHLFRPQEAIAVFTDIRAKALAFEGVAA